MSGLNYNFTNEDALVNFALDQLRRRGYFVTKNEAPRESPSQFKERLGISDAHFSRRLKDPRCPSFQHEKGEKRILWLQSNPALEAHMKKLQ